jgi:hypothetical protein
MADLMSVLAIAAVVGAASDGRAAPRPLWLEVETLGASSVMRVVAESDARCTATYELEVSGNAGGNRSVNRGTVTLPSRGKVTLATVKVGGGNAGGVTATLNVTPCGGEAYRQVWKSPAAPQGA